MSRIIILLFIIISIGRGEAQLKSGDLLFEISGTSEFSGAIAASTGSADSLNFVHIAILYNDTIGQSKVIEADPKEGVRVISLEDFLAKAPQVDGKPGVIVKRIKENLPVSEIIKSALSHLGEEYDWWYLPDNGKMYCSELVYESYLDAEGNHIFGTIPMNFRNADGRMPRFWTELYLRLDMEVPEGLPGTNPNQISQYPGLEEVFRFF